MIFKNKKGKKEAYKVVSHHPTKAGVSCLRELIQTVNCRCLVQTTGRMY